MIRREQWKIPTVKLVLVIYFLTSAYTGMPYVINILFIVT